MQKSDPALAQYKSQLAPCNFLRNGLWESRADTDAAARARRAAHIFIVCCCFIGVLQKSRMRVSYDCMQAFKR